MDLEFRNYLYSLRSNVIIIIQSLRDQDINKTGEKLFKYTVEPKCKTKKWEATFFDIKTKAEFYQMFNALISEVADKRLFPMLHFEMHAGEDGLQLGSMEMISWEELGELCRNINYYMKNELIVVLSACKGAFFYKSLDIRLTAPFWGYIGAKGDMYPGELLRDFTGFYNYLLGDNDLQAALDVLQDEEVGSKYVFVPVEWVFDELSISLDRIQESKEERFTRLLPEMRKLNPGLSENEVQSKLWENINSHNEKEYREQIKRKFLMK